MTGWPRRSSTSGGPSADRLTFPLLLSFALTFLRGIRAIGSGPVRFRSSPTAPPPAPGYRWLVLAGLLLGLARLVRSVGFAVLLILPPVLLLALRAWRQSLLGGLAVGLGLVGGPLVCASGIAVLFGVFELGSAGQFIATIPEIAWELSLGIYLTVKGFKPAPIIAQDAAAGIPEAASAERGAV